MPAASPAIAILILLSGMSVHAWAGVPVFIGLGDLAGGDFASQARDVSGDGRVVVGWSAGADGQHAFRWTAAVGMISLDQPGDASSAAFGVSGDGSIVVGSREAGTALHAFRWTSTDGMHDVGNTSPEESSIASAVSRDGSVIAGIHGATRDPGSGDILTGEAFRWTHQAGRTGLGYLHVPEPSSWSLSTSTDGAVVVGYSTAGATYQPFRWTAPDGMISLGDLEGGSNAGIAYATSADGSVIVGTSESAFGFEAFRWTETAGMVGLGDLPYGFFYSLAWDVSADGSVIVGSGSTLDAFGMWVDRAFIWDNVHGMRDLQLLLADEYGLDLAGWSLQEATGISADGRTIIGYGTNPAGQTEAWALQLPEPCTLWLLATLPICGRRRRQPEIGMHLSNRRCCSSVL